MTLTATQAKTLAKLIELAAATGSVDVSYPIKGVNTNSKIALHKAGYITITSTTDEVTGHRTMIATIN